MRHYTGTNTFGKHMRHAKIRGVWRMFSDISGGRIFLIYGANADAETAKAIEMALEDGAISELSRRIDAALRPKDK